MVKIYIDPRCQILYSSYYILGLWQKYGKKNVKFSSKYFENFEYKGRQDYDQFFAFVIVEKEQCSLLMITHDIAMSANMCDKLLVMENGCIVEAGDKEQVFNNPQHPFTKKLILAATDIEGYWEKIGITKAETKE